MSDIPYAQVVQAAKDAGAAIMGIYAQDFDVHTKDDNSPLTEADMAAHRTITRALESLTPEIPILSEESENAPWDARRQWTRYWLVDPLDGTKEFVKKNGEFTVNIALIDGGEPVWGVVHAPALGSTYHGGTATEGAWKELESGESHPIRVQTPPTGNTGWRIMGSRSHQSEAFKGRRLRTAGHQKRGQLAQNLPGRRGRSRSLPAPGAHLRMGHRRRPRGTARRRRPAQPRRDRRTSALQPERFGPEPLLHRQSVLNHVRRR